MDFLQEAVEVKRRGFELVVELEYVELSEIFENGRKDSYKIPSEPGFVHIHVLHILIHLTNVWTFTQNQSKKMFHFELVEQEYNSKKLCFYFAMNTFWDLYILSQYLPKATKMQIVN